MAHLGAIGAPLDPMDIDKESGEEESEEDEDATLVRTIPQGKMLMLGIPDPGKEPKEVRHRGHHPIVLSEYDGASVVIRYHVAPHSLLGVHEYARIPNALFTKHPIGEGETFEAQIHRDGKSYRWRSLAEWKYISEIKPAANGRRSFRIRGQRFYAAVLVESTTLGTRMASRQASSRARRRTK
jgi:hypothetical protein